MIDRLFIDATHTANSRLRASLRCLLVLAVTVLALPRLAAAGDFGLYGVDARAGINMPSDYDQGITIGVSADVWELAPGLYLHPGLFYSRADETIGSGRFAVDREATSFALGAEVRWFLTGERRGFYFGGGPYLNHVTLKQTSILQDVELSSNNVGAIGVAGYRLPLGGLSGFAEIRYNAVSGFNAAQALVGIGFGGKR